MSVWKTSALRGTTKEMGSMYASLTVLYARAISFSWTCVLISMSSNHEPDKTYVDASLR